MKEKRLLYMRWVAKVSRRRCTIAAENNASQSVIGNGNKMVRHTVARNRVASHRVASHRVVGGKVTRSNRARHSVSLSLPLPYLCNVTKWPKRQQYSRIYRDCGGIQYMYSYIFVYQFTHDLV